jgi:hypothetical protein
VKLVPVGDIIYFKNNFKVKDENWLGPAVVAKISDTGGFEFNFNGKTFRRHRDEKKRIKGNKSSANLMNLGKIK